MFVRLAGLMAVALVTLALVAYGTFAAYQVSASTNARLDRNLTYLRCSFEHLDEGQHRLARGLEPLANPCKATVRIAPRIAP